MLKIYHNDDILCFVEIMSTLLIDLINFILLILVGFFGHFDTSADVWVGWCTWRGTGKIHKKDHLSLAEADVEAKLGKNTK